MGLCVAVNPRQMLDMSTNLLRVHAPKAVYNWEKKRKMQEGRKGSQYSNSDTNNREMKIDKELWTERTMKTMPVVKTNWV